MNERRVPDALKVICDDLDREQNARRRHFVPALLLVVLTAGALLVLTGVRGDLFNQPGWKLTAQLGLWTMCLVLFPAVGLGLLFPTRGQRVALVIAAVTLTALATMSPHLTTDGDVLLHGCGVVVLSYGALLIGLGLFSGAFVQRRSAAAVFWVAGGVSLTALNTVTWHCPATNLPHLVPNHLGGAVGLMLLASIVGVTAHRRRRDKGGSGDEPTATGSSEAPPVA